jgi:hypothetical protein
MELVRAENAPFSIVSLHRDVGIHRAGGHGAVNPYTCTPQSQAGFVWHWASVRLLCGAGTLRSDVPPTPLAPLAPAGPRNSAPPNFLLQALVHRLAIVPHNPEEASHAISSGKSENSPSNAA